MSKKIHSYQSNAIEIRYDVARCIHAAECVHGAPAVFDPQAKPWIKPEAADGDAVAAVVMRCPTGALHFRRLDGGDEEAPAASNTVTVAADGPLYVRGDVTLVDAAGNVLLEDTRIALCRCGASKTKPLCDGSHKGIEFEDDGTVSARAASAEAAPDNGKLRLTCTADGPYLAAGAAIIVDAFGESAGVAHGAALCRCGASNQKPFCDGSHKRVGFRSD
jgi:CDGSH-type Zn-finger protein/uncharacterized Fe-S cluster protein YjdI